MIDSNFWYYTLSAIPQTLGAIIALSATFVVFKLNYFERSLDAELRVAKWFLLKMHLYEKVDIEDVPKKEIINEFKARIGPANMNLGLSQFAPYGNNIWDEFSSIVDQYNKFYTTSPERVLSFLKMTSKSLDSTFTNRENILGLLKTSLVISTIAIVFSLIFLPLFNLFVYHWPIVLIAIILALAGIIYSTISVWLISKY